MMIDTQNQSLFHWHFVQDQDSLTVAFQLNQEVVPTDFKVKLEEKKYISVSIPHQPPVLCGTFTEPVDSYSVRYRKSESKLFFVFKKCSSNLWDVIIAAEHPSLKIVDPNSAFLLYKLHKKNRLQSENANQKSGNNELDNENYAGNDNNNEFQDSEETDLYKKGLEYLNRAATQGYVPAIKELASIFRESDESSPRGPCLRHSSRDLLQLGADLYNDSDCCLELGTMPVLGDDQNGHNDQSKNNLNNNNNDDDDNDDDIDNNNNVRFEIDIDIDERLEYLEKGASLGNMECNVAIGKVLSPRSDVKSRRKNAAKAIQFLEKAENSPEAQHERAKLYMHGDDGVERDVKKAKELQRMAKKKKKEIPDIPGIQIEEEEENVEGINNNNNNNINNNNNNNNNNNEYNNNVETNDGNNEDGSLKKTLIAAGAAAAVGIVAYAVYKLLAIRKKGRNGK